MSCCRIGTCRRSFWRTVLLGAAAGAAGTTALNAVTYLDMALRARPASSTPEKTVEELSRRAGLRVPGQGDDRDNRVSALGALTGIAAGVGTGVLLGVARAAGFRPGGALTAAAATAAVLVASNGPMTAVGVTDPRSWGATDWVSDLIPHVAYAATTAAVLEALDRG